MSLEKGCAYTVLGTMALVSLCGFGIGLVELAVASAHFWLRDGRPTNGDELFEAITTLVVFGAGAAFLGFVFYRGILRRRLSERRLGEVGIELEPTEPRVGERLVVRLRIRPRVALRTLEGEAELTCTVMDPGGFRVDHRETQSLDTRRDLAADEDLVAETTFVLPLEAPPTRRGDPTVTWSLHVTLPVDRWPPWERTTFVAVLDRRPGI